MSDSNSIEDFLPVVKQEVKQEYSSDLNCDGQVTFDWESRIHSRAVVIGVIVPIKQDASVTSQKQAKMQLRSGKLIGCSCQSDNIADDSQQLGMKTTSSTGKSAFCDSVVTGRHGDQRQVVDGESQLACMAVATDVESLSDTVRESSAACSFLDAERVDKQLQASALVDADEDHCSLSHGVENCVCFRPFNNSPYDENEDIEPLTEHSLMEQLKTSDDALHDCMSVPVDQGDQSADTDTQHFQVNFCTHLLIKCCAYDKFL